MPDPTNIPAEDLPVAESLGHFVGLNGSDQGALYEALPIMAGRLLGVAGADTTLPPAVYEGYLLTFDNAAAQNFTIPTHATEPWPTLGCLHLVREGAGLVTVVAAVGVTLLTAGKPKIRANGSYALLRKIGENKWLLTGDTTA